MSGGGDLRNERTLDTRINRVCGDLAELAERVRRLEEQHTGVASLDVPCADCAAMRERVRIYEQLLAAAAARGSVAP